MATEQSTALISGPNQRYLTDGTARSTVGAFESTARFPLRFATHLNCWGQRSTLSPHGCGLSS